VSTGRGVLFRLATSGRFERAVRTMPGGDRWAWSAASRYVAGTTRGDAWATVQQLAGHGVGASVDQFGELVHDRATARRVADDYLKLAGELTTVPEATWLSVDLSHLGLDIDLRRCAEYLAEIASVLPAGRRIQVGAEDHDRAEAVLACVLTVAGRGLADRLGATVQANFHRAAADLDPLVSAGVHVRLVKGAYVEPPERALAYGEATDTAYLRLAHRLAEADARFALATHDGVLREALLGALGPRPIEQLLGVRPDVLDELIARAVPVRVYVPFGHGVEPICRVLDVSASAYYQRAGGERSARSVEDERLLERIRETHRQNYEAYGYRRLWKALRRAGEIAPRCQVQRLMADNGIRGAKRRGKPWRTTTPDADAPRRADLVNRDFTAEAPDRLWVADFTYLRCWQGLVFFAFVIDVYSRRVVGWQFASHMRTDLVLDALRMALGTRGPGAEVQLVHHSDRGSQGGLNRSSQHGWCEMNLRTSSLR